MVLKPFTRISLLFIFKMIDSVITYFETIDPVLAAFYASVFTWLLTAAGASLVFVFQGMNRALLDGMLGFTGGVMVAASFWSLLAPGIEMSEGEGFVKVIPAVVGFALGALFIYGLDKIYPIYILILKNPKRKVLKPLGTAPHY
jgi:Predicted divalent heavy-metal cations transporter